MLVFCCLIYLDFIHDCFFTGAKNISFCRKRKCPGCNGDGINIPMCNKCNGKGFTIHNVTASVRLDANDLNHRDVRQDGKGDTLPNFSQAGDLVLRLRYRPRGFHAMFKQRIIGQQTKQSKTKTTTKTKEKVNVRIKSELFHHKH